MWQTHKITYAKRTEVNEKKVIKDLTFVIPAKIKNVKPKIVKLYSYVNNYILVPRFYPETAEKKFRINPDIKFQGPDLYSNNQKVVYQELQKIYSQPAGRILIMQTGQGKTYLGIKMIEFLKKRTLIITHNKEIAYCWFNLIKDMNSHSHANTNLDSSLTVGFVGDSKKIKGDITVAIIHTLLKQPLEWFRDFDFVIYDEITEFVSDTRRAIFDLAARPYLLALTATPDIELKFVFELNIGPYLFTEKIPGFNKLEIPWKVNVDIVKYRGEEEHTQQLKSCIGTTNVILMDKQFMEDPVRNKLIIDKITWLMARNKNMFIFYSICELGEKLYNLLPENLKQYAAILTGKHKTHEMQEIVNSKKIIFTTYKFSAKGISITKMDSVILATPQISNTEQVIGRILRIGGDYTSERFVIDIVDFNTSLRSQYYERKKFYKNTGFKFI